ncbi:MAG: Fe-S cluster assembly protein SufD [Chloroflexi bacterium]|nr:Fe-S cluster assembly protein SufD [Chloroflexota bacterium]|tara:strand:+ start:10422 stop:11756 length:1335 start_codon:yes stop_codon:yes gene_type:complete
MSNNKLQNIKVYEEMFKTVIADETNNELNISRKKSWDIFSSKGIPTSRKKNELWKYTNLNPIEKNNYELDLNDESTQIQINDKGLPIQDSWNNIILVNGKFSKRLSDNGFETGVSFYDLSDLRQNKNLISKISKIAKSSEHVFVALNSALFQDIAFIKISSQISQPINIINIISNDNKQKIVLPRIYFEVEENINIDLIESYVNFSQITQFVIPVTEIKLNPKSSLNHFRIQSENEKTFHIATTRVSQELDSKFSSVSFATGASIGRNDILTELMDEGSESDLKGIYITHGKQQQDHEISTSHKSPHCSSNQFYKGILSGKSHAVFSGKVIVERDAQKSVANQKDLNLMLSYGAEIDAKPSLEIYADDVECAHGATAGHVDKNSLFYLLSRGVSEFDAKSMLVRGFAEEMLDEFTHEKLSAFVGDLINKKIPLVLSESDTIGTA